jgi:hypothetical protein
MDESLNSISIAVSSFYGLVMLHSFIAVRYKFLRSYIPRLILVILVAGLNIFIVVYVDNVTIIDFNKSRYTEFLKPFQIVFGCLLTFWGLWFLYSFMRIVIITKHHPNLIPGRFRLVVGVIVLYELVIQGVVFVTVIWPSLRGNTSEYVLLAFGNMFGFFSFYYYYYYYYYY